MILSAYIGTCLLLLYIFILMVTLHDVNALPIIVYAGRSGGGCKGGYLIVEHRLNMELDLQSLFGLQFT